MFLGLLGYSDDNICLSPSLNAIQEMLKTCEEFAMSHNLRFSTNPDPKKCKTKTLAFLQARDLPSMMLCGNPLPWTDTWVFSLENEIDACELDMKVKMLSILEKIWI